VQPHRRNCSNLKCVPPADSRANRTSTHLRFPLCFISLLVLRSRALAMPRCNRIVQGYDDCGHKVSTYKFCGDSHANTHEKREDCYNTRALPAPTTQTAPNLDGKCPPCLSKLATWDCCQCEKVVEAGSDTCKCSHSFCLDCSRGIN